MATTINNVWRFGPASSPAVDIAANPDALGGVAVAVKYTVDAGSGDDIAASAIGLQSIDALIAGDANTTFDDASPLTATVGDTNGDHYFIAIGTDMKASSNVNTNLTDNPS